MPELICERTIDIVDNNTEGSESGQELIIAMYKPVPDHRNGGDWECSFEIRGLPDPLERTAYGVDSFQALLHCIKMIDAHLKSLQREGKRELCWLGMGDLGFHLDEMKP
jgi:hypothetical protein